VHATGRTTAGAVAGAFTRKHARPLTPEQSHQPRAITQPAEEVTVPHPRRRGLLRRYLEVRGTVGGIRHPELVARLRTADGVTLRGSYLAAPDLAASDVAVLLAHGFMANRHKPSYARLAEGIARRLPVLSLDMRGHGASGGRSTLGDREAMDVEAGAAWLRGVGHQRVVAIGASMGATSVLHAASRGLPLTGVVTISAPALFRMPPHGRSLAQLHEVWHSPWKRRVLRAGFGVALDGPEAWSYPPHPEEMVRSIEAPLLFVHGDDDTYFPSDDADLLSRGAKAAAVVWHEPTGFGHAEDGLTPAFVARLVGAVAEVASTGRFPDRATSTSRWSVERARNR
jgi:uncharacterized protein